MKYVVSSKEMKEYDRRTIENHQMDGLILMERAALGLAAAVMEKKKAPARVLVVAGRGNNGGDGLAAGRILWQAGYQVDFFLAGNRDGCSEACKKQLDILKSYGITVPENDSGKGIFSKDEYDIIIDALFGIGLSRPLGGDLAGLAEQINGMKGYKVACDLPSGIETDTGQIMGTAVRADMTVTFAFLKRGLLLYPGAAYAGKVRCVSMGITEDSFPAGTVPGGFTYDREDLCRLPKRRADGNKGTFGKILLAAGSHNMAGAACLCAQSCYRSGSGLVRVWTPSENRVILQSRVPEAVLRTYEGGEQLTETETSRLEQDVFWADGIIAGPGMGMGEAACQLLEQLLLFLKRANARFLVLDADALNLLAARPNLQELLAETAKARPELAVILTPHLGEFSRLTKIRIEKLKEDIITYATEFAKKSGFVVVCKDACTVTVGPDSGAYLNGSGSHALATAGSGDVLAGIIGGLAGQGMDGLEAAALGVYVHGLVGEEAAAQGNPYSVMAGDLPGMLCLVLKKEDAESRK